METVTYLLKKIPRELWAKIKAAAYEEESTLAEWLLDAAKQKLKRGK